MNVGPVLEEVPLIPNAMIGEAALPNLPSSANHSTECVRVSTLDQLNRALQSYVGRWSEQDMDVFGHHNKRVQCKATIAAVTVNCS